MDEVEKKLSIIKNLCSWLDFFASTTIVHSTDCCIAGDYATLLINAYTDKNHSIIEEKALQAVRQLNEMLHDVWIDIDYGEKTGFSKTQRWLDFVHTITITNALLQDAVKELTEKNNIPAYWNELKELWNEFDPIGVFQIDSDCPDDEYHSYIIPTYTLLSQNADFNKIYTYINDIVKKHMGMESVNNQYIINFIHKLQNWHAQRNRYSYK